MLDFGFVGLWVLLVWGFPDLVFSLVSANFGWFWLLLVLWFMRLCALLF